MVFVHAFASVLGFDGGEIKYTHTHTHIQAFGKVQKRLQVKAWVKQENKQTDKQAKRTSSAWSVWLMIDQWKVWRERERDGGGKKPRTHREGLAAL